MKTSLSFRTRVANELRKARSPGYTKNLVFTHNEVADILEDLETLYQYELEQDVAKSGRD